MSDFSEQPQKMSDEELLWLVRHKVRRSIIIAVGEEGRIGATALKQKLGISTGSLYYNLRQMSQLITQDEKKTYRLTEDGLKIYKLLTQSNDAQTVPKPSRAVETVSSIFFPLWLYSPIYESRVVAAVLGPLSVFVLAFVLLAGRYELFLLNPVPAAPLNILIFAAKFTLTYAVALVMTSLLSPLFAGRIRSVTASITSIQNSWRNFFAELGKLSSSLAVSFLPLGLVPGLAVVDRVLRTSILSNILLRDTLLILSQTISILLLSAAVAYGKKMRWQNSMGVALTYFYLSTLIGYFKPLG